MRVQGRFCIRTLEGSSVSDVQWVRNRPHLDLEDSVFSWRIVILVEAVHSGTLQQTLRHHVAVH